MGRSGVQIFYYPPKDSLYIYGGYNPDIENGKSDREDFPIFKDELWRFALGSLTWEKMTCKGTAPRAAAFYASKIRPFYNFLDQKN